MSALGILAEGLRKEFALGHGQPPKRAVDGISFTIAEGERVGLVGRNGAGKTTLLQLLAGIAEPSGGRLSVQGHVTAVFTLGMGLREDLSGRENVFVEGELLGRSREQTQALVDEIVAFAELGEFIDRPVRTYSTGMKARLAFSTIVHIEPEILIIDEALSVGDVRFAAKATAKMRELAARGRILIVVSHSMAAIQEMCNRCLWIDAGRIRMDGPPAQVTQAYLDEVRRADESALFERFRRELADESLLPGWRIEALELQSGAAAGPSSLVTGEPAALMVAVAGEPGAAFDARLRVDRLDGIPVLESRWPDAAQSAVVRQDGRRRLWADFGDLPLNQGIYRAHVELRSAGRPAARRSTVFEVHNPRPPRGGRPLIVYPVSISSTRTAE